VTIQRLFDLFCGDMEHNLREMGVSDLAVPKEMRRFGEAFYGRLAAYDRALDAADEAAVVDALRRNVFAGNDGAGNGATRLARYVLALAEDLAARDVGVLTRGQLTFAGPAALMPADPP
jgi:cytochrome b pre-mRNA-processing protein 3